MNSVLLSDDWYRVQALHPRLRTHVSVQRRVYRGQVWYLLCDTNSGRHHRLTESAYHIVGRLTGALSVQQVWEVALAKLGEYTPTQDEIIQLLSVLHDAHLIQSEKTPDLDQLFSRRDSIESKKRLAAVNPLSFRVPLWDPTAFLDRWVQWIRACFSVRGLIAWITIIALATVMILPHWRELGIYGARLLDARYLMLMVLCYPFIKALHELGHAFAVRVWGGEVREMGIALLLLVPVPYVNASAASAFRERHRRVVVGAAGIMVELLLAAIAAVLWINTEDGAVRDVAFVVMAIGGLSTVLFNGNPLMRLDGYYMLSDALDMPNLSTRANNCVTALLKRYMLGITASRDTLSDRFEQNFLPVYCVLSNAYRLFISAMMVWWIASKSPVLALIAGAGLLFTQIGVPIFRAAHFILRSPATARYRARGVAVSMGVVAAAVVLVFILPAPNFSHAMGVVWFPENAQIRALTSGFVHSVHAADSAAVSKGDTLIELVSPELQAKHAVTQARVQALQARVRYALQEDHADVQSASQELLATEAELAEIARKIDGLTIQAGAQGRLILPQANDLRGTFLKQGTNLGHVVNHDDLLIRVAVTQEQAGRIREGVTGVQVRMVDSTHTTHHGRVVHEVPAGDNRLHSAALGDRSGGPIRTDPADQEGLRTLEPVFLFDIEVEGIQPERVGGRAHVLFDHGFEPIGMQWTRALRQVFLRHLSI